MTTGRKTIIIIIVKVDRGSKYERNGRIKMNTAFAAGAVAAGGLFLGTAVSAAAAGILFNRVIPRQDGVKVDLNEMADMAQWEEYKKIIHVNKEWLLAQPLEHINIKSRDGLKLSADYLPAEFPSDKIALCLHGYTGCGKSDCCSVGAFLHRKGYDIILVDHRAHGESEGKYIGFGILDRFDCLSWIKYINKRFEGKKDILIYGISMGAATALMTAGFPDIPKNVRVIIADCGYTSPYEVFAHVLKKDYHLPEFPIMQMNDKLCQHIAGYGFSDYSSNQAVRVTDIPILFIHGKNDNFVPTQMSIKNYNDCKSPKELLLVDNAGHGASYYENTELYESTVNDFLAKYMR